MSAHTPACDWPADHLGACPERQPTRFPVTDDIVWCSDCWDYHLPRQHRAPLTGGSTPTAGKATDGNADSPMPDNRRLDHE